MTRAEPNSTGVMVTGVSVICPLADQPDALLEAMLAGKSALGRWPDLEDSPCLSKIGGDLSTYPLKDEIDRLRGDLPDAVGKRLRRLTVRVPPFLAHSLLLAARAWRDAHRRGIAEPPPERTGVIGAGHNLNMAYIRGELGALRRRARLHGSRIFRLQPGYDSRCRRLRAAFRAGAFPDGGGRLRQRIPGPEKRSRKSPLGMPSASS